MRLDRIKLKTALLQSDMKQKELAEKTGLTRNTINAVCCGKGCTEATALKIAAGLGVNLSQLVENK